MTTWTTPPTFAVGQLIDPTTLNTYIRDNATYLYNGMPNRATLWHDAVLVLTGNALIYPLDANQFFNGYVYQNVAANGDSFTHSCYLKAGTYDFDVLGMKHTVCGIVDWYLDGTLIQSGQDWYASAATYNVVQTVASVVLSAGGYHTIKGIVNGKNASSTGYQMRLTGYWFQPHPSAMTD